MPPRGYYKPRVAIRGTASGFVEAANAATVEASSIFDGDVERAVARATTADALPAGLYLAEWQDERGTPHGYVFCVEVERREIRRITVEP